MLHKVYIVDILCYFFDKYTVNCRYLNVEFHPKLLVPEHLLSDISSLRKKELNRN